MRAIRCCGLNFATCSARSSARFMLPAPRSSTNALSINTGLPGSTSRAAGNRGRQSHCPLLAGEAAGQVAARQRRLGDQLIGPALGSEPAPPRRRRAKCRSVMRTEASARVMRGPIEMAVKSAVDIAARCAEFAAFWGRSQACKASCYQERAAFPLGRDVFGIGGNGGMSDDGGADAGAPPLRPAWRPAGRWCRSAPASRVRYAPRQSAWQACAPSRQRGLGSRPRWRGSADRPRSRPCCAGPPVKHRKRHSPEVENHRIALALPPGGFTAVRSMLAAQRRHP